MVNAQVYDGGAFDLWRIGGESSRLYKATIKGGTKSITLTGANVTKELKIPFMHRLVSIKLYQTNAAHDANTDAFAVTFQRAAGTVTDQPYFVDVLWYNAALVVSTAQENFGETYEYEPAIWSLILNGTNTNIMELQIYFMKCEP